MNQEVTDPLFGAAPSQIPLKNAPLVRVLSQVQFTEVLSITRPDFIADFQEKLRHSYPSLQRNENTLLAVGPNGTTETRNEIIWRFADPKGAWRLSLATGFVALETREYKSRADFIDRLGKALEALEATIKPEIATRVGVRYVDRVVGDHTKDLEKLLRPEIVGVTTASIRKHLNHSISEIQCGTAEGSLGARWGWLPPNGSYDPENVPAIPERSWILDIDAYKQLAGEPQKFEVSKLISVAEALATRAYTFFRWAVTKDFLVQYGGAL